MKYKNKSPPPNTKFVKYKNNYDELNKESYMKLTNTLLSTGALVALGLGMTLTTTTVHAMIYTSCILKHLTILTKQAIRTGIIQPQKTSYTSLPKTRQLKQMVQKHHIHGLVHGQELF